MTPELQALGRRAVACKHFRWMPGMLTDVGERVIETWICYLGTLPDLSDPATLGCLLALVREAWDDPRLTVECEFDREMWHCSSGSRTNEVWNIDIDQPFYGNSEAAALVAALEAAPCD